MSLVAYASSGESDSEDDSPAEQNVPGPSAKTDKTAPQSSAETNSSGICSALPLPKAKTVNPLLSMLVIGGGKSEKVKIGIPSLPEIIQDDEKPARKKLKPSSSGSGLIAALPPPRAQVNTFVKKALIPQSLQRKLVPVKKQLPVKPSTSTKSDDEDDSDVLDFFSLSSEKKTNVSVPSLAPIVPKLPDIHTETTPLPVIQPQPATEIPDEESNEESPLELNEKAMIRLQGKRRRNEDITLVDISADNIMTDREMWMTKQLSEEKDAYAHRRDGGFSSEHRKKHQITYLAHEAKARELELKNQWADNRMSRRQTQSKYGF